MKTKSEKIDYDFLIGEVKKFATINELEREITILHLTFIVLEPCELFFIQQLMKQKFTLKIGAK